MLRRVLIGIAAVVVLFVIVVATRPATFHIERSVVTSASAESVQAEVADFHAWRAWSPWEKLDPDMKRSFGGADRGQGATYSWAGSNEVGEGRMTIEQSEPGKVVRIKLEFIKPFPATNTATFTFQPVPAGTKVTWAMDGQNNFLSKAFHLFMDMDGIIGAEFDKGLAAMKSVAESRQAKLQ
jgi:hypothetical protein